MSQNIDQARRLAVARRAVGIGLLSLVWVASALFAATPRVNEPAPDFALRSSTGKNLRLSEYRGDVVLLNFWTTSCGRCREQLDQLEDVYQAYRDAGFTVLSVAIGADTDRARELANEMKLSFPILYDDRKTAARLYDPNSIPLTLLIDPHGQIRFVHEDYQRGDEDIYSEQLTELLAE